MFEIPDGDLQWDDDFPLEDNGLDEAKSVNNGRSLRFESRLSVQNEVSQDTPVNRASINATTTTLCNKNSAEKIRSKKGNCNGSFGTSAEDLANVCRRKFPGPAGVLPCSPFPELDTKLHDTPFKASLPRSPAVGNQTDEPPSLPWSQVPTDDVFASPQWKALVSDLGEDAQTLLDMFSIRSALLKANRKLLQRGKIPLIIGVMEGIDMQGSDASFVLRDPSGKMKGALHRDLFKDPSTALQAGSVLVLRQVSVISPSSRTHYLNITPANVALIYAVHREAVSIRQWCNSSSLTMDTKLTADASESCILSQIIEDSKQEVADRNFHQGNETCGSPSLLRRSGEFHLNRNLNSKYMPFSATRNSLALTMHGNNNIPFGAGSSKGVSPIFTSAHTFVNVTPSRNVNSWYTGHSPGNTTESFRQPSSKRVMSPVTPVLGSNYVSARADRISCNADLHNKSAVIGSGLMPTIQRSLLPNSPDEALRKENSLGYNNRFDGDFPDTDDQMMIHMCDEVSNQSPAQRHNRDTDDQMMIHLCDEVSNQTPAKRHNRQTISSVLNHPEKLSGHSGSIAGESMSANIISKVFQDCRKENQRVDGQSVNDYKLASHFSNAGNKFISAGNGSIHLKSDATDASDTDTSQNNVDLSQSSSIGKQFSFKRGQTPSHLSLPYIAAKRPMFDAANQNSASYMKSPFNNRPEVNSRLMSDLENKERMCHQNSFSAVTNIHSVVQITHSAVSGVRHTVPSVKPAENSSTIQLKTRGRDSKSTDQKASMFQHWDDDLNDDLLLSQLSDEF